MPNDDALKPVPDWRGWSSLYHPPDKPYPVRRIDPATGKPHNPASKATGRGKDSEQA